MAIKLDGNKKDLYDHDNVKILNEKETRQKLIARARSLGIERDLLTILNKYDNLIRNCPDEKERKDMGKLGAYEVYNLFNKGGSLYVDGMLVYKGE